MHNAYGTSAGSVSNNPFIDDPTNPRNRFPDISATISPAVQTTTTQYTSSWVNSQPTGYAQQSYSQYQQQHPQYSVQAQPTGYTAHNLFQPSSAFGQQLSSQINGSSYGYLTGQTTSPTLAYNPAQQQLLSNPNYVAQFDPYAPIGQGWDGNQSRNPPQSLSPPTSVGSIGVPSSQQALTTSRSATGLLHPREFVRTYKTEVESWDGYTWRQLLSTFESLKDAWETRKKELAAKVGQMQQQMAYANYYQAQQIQQEGSRLQGVCFVFFFMMCFLSPCLVSLTVYVTAVERG